MDKTMKGTNVFTKSEINELRELIRQRVKADRSTQKSIRNRMRAIGFYGRDDFDIVDMTVEKFDKLIADERIIVKDEISDNEV